MAGVNNGVPAGEQGLPGQAAVPSEAGPERAQAGGGATGGESNIVFKKKAPSKNVRRRARDDGDDDDAAGGASAVVKKSSKQPRWEKDAGTPDEAGAQKKAGFVFDSSRQVQVVGDAGATRTNEMETEFDKDGRALREQQLKKAGQGKEVDDKVYRGMNAYTDHRAGFRREHTIAGEKGGGAHGPLRASAHLRASVRFDYQPDLCKDYKETGYCGFGDACKFMHDRGDYKSGWQMEKEWDEKEKLRKARLAQGVEEEQEDDDEDSDEDALPFACFICRQPFKDPVVVGHR
ncbi:hypothetical protein KFL_001200240 [Klebsormidium nitens]|uniref:C3H1-type domain-containing protein n=1 Tax=Klebsormidium nitens TaxID=105231 RepID=A0A1Y1HVP4_KLENI|nr:hypothetical protein KFL_001200240 [Klebsormidium nitens]|eukprot:GAQ82700.1 hypothetical protein KFL_001200240 [Klebsormidium nitens]